MSPVSEIAYRAPTEVILIEFDLFALPFFFPPSLPLSSSLLVVAVIKASELWAAMAPELLVTVRAELEPASGSESEQQDKDENKAEEEVEEDDRATAVKVAQYLRVNKYR